MDASTETHSVTTDSASELVTQVLVTQSCLTLCDPMDGSLPVSSVHGISQARILEWVAMSFPIQGLNPGLLHCRQTLYHLSHQGRPKVERGN